MNYRSTFYAFVFLLLPVLGFTQSGQIVVKVSDYLTKQPVVGAKVILSEKFKALTDYSGNAEFNEVPYGKYKAIITMMGLDTIVQDLELKQAILQVKVTLGGTLELDEMKVIGNLVTDRKTPIPVTRIDPKKIQEELGSRDIPMLLNATPGVFATQSGGGDGDSRITVRGFDQRNVGVMIDGVPVNDMENGWVYWSNWFGLDNITSNIQIQRGLGATKLAMPSVGGTINILTQGIGGRKGFAVKQEYATGNMLRTSLSYNSGLTKRGFGVTFSGSYKTSQGIVDGTNSRGWFYYLKVQKKINSHLISLSAFAAPQQHGQRSFNQPIQYFDNQAAIDQGLAIDTGNINNRGINYNEHWGYITKNGKQEILNERLNYFTKPQITLKDFWQVNKKFSISNIAYLSVGRGGGTKLFNYGAAVRKADGTIDWDQISKNNQYTIDFGQTVYNIDPTYSTTEYKSNNIITASVNNHFWLGYLSQFSYEYSKQWSFAGGLDYRYYEGEHYREIKNLLGGGYYVNNSNQNQATSMLREGDMMAENNKPYENHRRGLVQWAGMFGQAEYSGTRWTAFLNLSTVVNGYKGIDYFQKRELTVGDTTLKIGYSDTINYQGQTYDRNSSGLEYNQTEWRWLPGFTSKVGASYTLSEEAVIFFNAGYLSRTPMFSNVIDNNYNKFFKDLVNEKILAFEAGYGYAKKKFGINVNGYFTNWKNKPIPFGVQIPDPNDPTSFIRLNVRGMDALHMGGEVDLAWQLTKKISTEIMLSVGDWKWKSVESLYVPEIQDTFSFDARNVHVSDAAQTSFSGAIRYEPFKNFYLKAQYMFFDRYYAQFSPFNLTGANAGKDSWQLPSYGMLNLFAGYRHKLKKMELLFNGNISNALNSIYISDAINNQFATNFDAASAGVMFGQGFRLNLSLGIQF